MMKCIKIADLCIGFEYNGEIKNERLYEPFYTDEKPDVIINIYRDSIPYYDEKKTVSIDNYYYCDMGNERIILLKYYLDNDYCSYMFYGNNDYKLYIRPNILLTDSFVFTAMNFSYFMSLFNRLIIHSSFVSYNNEAILFCGDKGVGKSTQADLWAKNRNCYTVNGDRAILYVKENKLYAYGLPFCGSSDIALNEFYPVKKIVMLDKGEKNCLFDVSEKNRFLSLLNKFSYNTADFTSVKNASDLTSFIVENKFIINFKAENNSSAVDYLEGVLCR